MPCNHCNEFSRAHLLRGAAAEAGRGLPQIEPGMPIPAGTGLSRRSFMLRAGLGMMSVYGASRLGFADLQSGIARAQGASDPIIVSVFMDGGMDSLSVLAPVTDSVYNSLRGDLRLIEGQGPEFAEDDSLMWHPRATALDTLHRAGKLSVLPAVGYTDPDQSHFTSRHYWEVGELDANERTGWLGRLIDVIGAPDNPIQGLSLDGWLLPSLASTTNPVAAIDGSSYDLWAPGVWEPVDEIMFEHVQAMGQVGGSSGDAGRAVAGRTADQSIELRSTLENFGEVTVPPVYPDDDHWFCQNMSALSAMIDADLPIRCVSVSAPGSYDTHDNQAGTFGDDIGITFDTLAAFQADLEARGLADRVITLVYSEFGRRPEQNATGTDHGAAGAAFVMGTKVQGEMVGEWPGLGTLDEDDNVVHTSDFRALYCSILEQWFDVDAAQIIPGASSFARPQIIAP
ncbi:MAG: hypothetical protein QOI31_2797 [Solirubrobacterales bacterium]|jgi:uncharacterized protein (DUF1501 family)|nr:hypothetical protein [Solirubrobacterales bacterium]